MDEMMVQTLFLTFGFMGMLYFLTIRPENKRKKEVQTMRDALKEGDDITTIGGIAGKICAVKEATIVFETGADRVRIEVAKWAVANKGLPTVATPTETGK